MVEGKYKPTNKGRTMAIKREALMSKLKEMGVSVNGTTEDFGTTEGGIWVGMEDGLLAQYPMSYSTKAIDEFEESKVNKVIRDAGYFLEMYDGGTAMIWVI